MKSVRLGAELELELERAARAEGVTHSEFIRDAVARRCGEVLGESLAERLEPVIGVVNSSEGRASETGKVFRRALAKKRRGK